VNTAIGQVTDVVTAPLGPSSPIAYFRFFPIADRKCASPESILPFFFKAETHAFCNFSKGLCVLLMNTEQLNQA
jgi:hypothetical protein